MLWDEPAFPIDQVKIGQPGTNFAHWDITRAVVRAEQGRRARQRDERDHPHAVRVRAARQPVGAAQLDRLHRELTAIGALGEPIDPKLVYQGDATSKLLPARRCCPLGTIPATQPSH
jgi:hypothetical protein